MTLFAVRRCRREASDQGLDDVCASEDPSARRTRLPASASRSDSPARRCTASRSTNGQPLRSPMLDRDAGGRRMASAVGSERRSESDGRDVLDSLAPERGVDPVRARVGEVGEQHDVIGPGREASAVTVAVTALPCPRCRVRAGGAQAGRRPARPKTPIPPVRGGEPPTGSSWSCHSQIKPDAMATRAHSVESTGAEPASAENWCSPSARTITQTTSRRPSGYPKFPAGPSSSSLGRCAERRALRGSQSRNRASLAQLADPFAEQPAS